MVTVERNGRLMRIPIEAPTRKLAVLNYRHDVNMCDVILNVTVKRKKAVDFVAVL
jgi:hypothetical protein